MLETINIGHTTIVYSVGLQLSLPDEDHIHIISIRTKFRERNKGSARAALTQLLAELDDKYNLPITLEASPLDKKTQLNRLVRFYESFGFKWNGKYCNPAYDPVMLRPAQGAKIQHRLRF